MDVTLHVIQDVICILGFIAFCFVAAKTFMQIWKGE